MKPIEGEFQSKKSFGSIVGEAKVPNIQGINMRKQGNTPKKKIQADIPTICQIPEDREKPRIQQGQRIRKKWR
jgi:hypothetical protein